ncbi:hypothetical protein OTB20_40945 [Streptomyces sp. H27-H1]|uniref:hypothetical protein n=1 Tax=Streptomyces sp. H27-H1 TaxID=2996461 RepID=UPI00226F7EBB|nr:hypothetical protein [Streptomyces sp. H27-H1]MCY0932408.1 hypothetical protein [Streptomyces sp. H27-H1]
MVSAGRSRVWLRVGRVRIRADKVTAVTPAEGDLHLQVTGHPGGLVLHLPPGPPRTGRNGHPVDWADELLHVIEQAAAQPVGTLITFAAVNHYQAAGFTAHSLTGDERRLIEPPLLPVPDLIPPRPAPAHWATPRAPRDSTAS